MHSMSEKNAIEPNELGVGFFLDCIDYISTFADDSADKIIMCKNF